MKAAGRLTGSCPEDAPFAALHAARTTSGAPARCCAPTSSAVRA